MSANAGMRLRSTPSGASAADAFSYELECNISPDTDWSSTCVSDVASTANQHHSGTLVHTLLVGALDDVRIRAVKDGVQGDPPFATACAMQEILDLAFASNEKGHIALAISID